MFFGKDGWWKFGANADWRVSCLWAGVDFNVAIYKIEKLFSNYFRVVLNRESVKNAKVSKQNSNQTLRKLTELKPEDLERVENTLRNLRTLQDEKMVPKCAIPASSLGKAAGFVHHTSEVVNQYSIKNSNGWIFRNGLTS